MGAKVDRAKLRDRMICVRLTEAEYLDVLRAAGMGQPTEWARRVLLAQFQRVPLEEAVLAEVLASRTVMLNVLAKLAPTVDIRALNEHADKDKRDKAQSALSGETR
jgi:hypothetical protein